LNYRAIQIGILIAIASVSTLGQTAAKAPCLNHIGAKEWAILVADLEPGKRKLLEDDEARKAQIDNIRELLAFACEATRSDLASEEPNSAELQFIRSETIASEYDRKRTKLKPGPPFGWITDAQVVAFYKKPTNLTAFERFFVTKMELLNMSVAPSARRTATLDDEAAARDYYARMKIAETSAATLLTPAEKTSAEFKARMQQAQFLARLAANEIGPAIAVDDAAVADYIARHPEFDSKAAREKAAKLRDRAKAGEDFAALANEFSEDPGNDGDNGKKNGGLYSNVAKGVMVPQFERASLALQPGQISDLVESDFGFHIIKLERKSIDGSNYDVRHILIATALKDPNDPNGRPVPVPVYVRAKLEGEREAKVIEQLLVRNPVTVEDVKLPAAPATRPPATRTVKTTGPAKRKR